MEIPAEWNRAPLVVNRDSEGMEYVVFVPEQQDAELRLTRDYRGKIAAAEWVEVCAFMSRAKKRLCEVVQCGDFGGYMVEFLSVDTWVRGWSLHKGDVPLDVCYRCKASAKGRDDMIVDEMLRTLRLEP
jgi:hypothetical protein